MIDLHNLIGKCQDEETRAWLKADAKNLLLAELFLAELLTRKGGKRKTHDTQVFETDLMENLVNLRDALWNLEYKPSRSTAHIINKPVKREIFAAPYRDRVVHRFVVDSIIDWWEKRLIYDSYSCRVGKGTDFGIERLRHHVRKVSKGFTRPAYVIKMDISGYFMHIKRDILYERVIWGLDRQFSNIGYDDRRYKILKHAIREIIMDDPIKGVKINGSYENWRDLPEDKSLFCQPPGQGMVIGNFTSQTFSNIYLDMLDRFVTLTLGYKHYGRYVDDFFVVVAKEELSQAKKDVREIETFLEGLGLKLNLKKTRVLLASQGVPFLGKVIKNDILMPDKRCVKNFRSAMRDVVSGARGVESVASYLGLMCHCDSRKVCLKVFDEVGLEYAP